VLARPQGRRAPPAADVEQPHAGADLALAEREVDLGHLRLGQRGVGAVELGARVRHRRVEEQAEELVAQVVMCLDRLEVDRQSWVGGAHGAIR
jgi:hypothetical protein